MIYDDENEEEEEVKIEGDNNGMANQSTTTVQQQENDSSNHPVWKMKLIGHSPTTKQYVYSMYHNSESRGQEEAGRM